MRDFNKIDLTGRLLVMVLIGCVFGVCLTFASISGMGILPQVLISTAFFIGVRAHIDRIVKDFIKHDKDAKG